MLIAHQEPHVRDRDGERGRDEQADHGDHAPVPHALRRAEGHEQLVFVERSDVQVFARMLARRHEQHDDAGGEYGTGAYVHRGLDMVCHASGECSAGERPREHGDIAPRGHRVTELVGHHLAHHCGARHRHHRIAELHEHPDENHRDVRMACGQLECKQCGDHGAADEPGCATPQRSSRAVRHRGGECRHEHRDHNAHANQHRQIHGAVESAAEFVESQRHKHHGERDHGERQQQRRRGKAAFHAQHLRVRRAVAGGIDHRITQVEERGFHVGNRLVGGRVRQSGRIGERGGLHLRVCGGGRCGDRLLPHGQARDRRLVFGTQRLVEIGPVVNAGANIVRFRERTRGLRFRLLRLRHCGIIAVLALITHISHSNRSPPRHARRSMNAE